MKLINHLVDLVLESEMKLINHLIDLVIITAGVKLLYNCHFVNITINHATLQPQNDDVGNSLFQILFSNTLHFQDILLNR